MDERRIVTTDGNERVINGTVIGKFASALRGEVLYPGDESYDAVRRVWNGMIDKRPALIARCTGAADVIACVRFAREHDLLVSVRGGGHHYAGKSVCAGGLMIDLAPMKGIRVDPVGRTAWAQTGPPPWRIRPRDPGVWSCDNAWGQHRHWIAGLTLGGGYGWLAGKFGLACDNLRSADVVTADGRLVTAAPGKNDDLFWGLRGAGANFGIVTSFEYALHQVGPVLGGTVVYPLTQGRAVLQCFDEFSSTCPDEVSTSALLVTTPTGEPAVAIAVCYCGALDFGEKVLEPLTRLGAPLANDIEVKPYVQLQTMFDPAWPPGRLYYIKSSVVRRLSEAAIDRYLHYARSMPTPLSAIAFQQLHGTASRVGSGDTAFPHRYDHFNLYIHPATDDPADASKIVRWGRDCWEAMQPYVDRAVYVNAMEDVAADSEQPVRDAYGANYERLTALKKKYDPTNFFSANQNIKPPM
jgi:FAD/FMN-containing dehydrogenase